MPERDTDPAPQSSTEEKGEAEAPAATGAQPARGRRAAPAEPEVTQADPTAPQPVDEATGLVLDKHGLPISGPARLRWLADAGIEVDPAQIAAEEAENANG
ncbi:MAG: hypothetical protein J0H88_16255 [Sphingomonadales bacterium]|nr:hypothetical protein [Sphingomonadales bacterium]